MTTIQDGDVAQPEEKMNVDMARCHRLVELERNKARLEEDLKTTKKEIESLWDPIISDMLQAGLRSIPLTDGEVLTCRRFVFCAKKAGVPKAAAIHALESAGLGHMCQPDYSAAMVKDLVKEADDQLRAEGKIPSDMNELLPEALRPVFNASDLTRVVVTGAKANARLAPKSQDKEPR